MGIGNEAPKLTGTLGRWLRERWVTVLGFLLVTWWITPLLWPRGIYAGYFHFLDLEIGFAGGLIWAVAALVSMAPPGWKRPLALRAGLALGVLLAAAAACDVCYVLWNARVRNFWYYGQSFSYANCIRDPELVWRFRPGFSFAGRSTPAGSNVQFRTDEHGFRNPTGIGRADVVFLGDSVTMAAEVPEESTFVQKSAAALGITAVNLGIYCYSPQQELVVLKRYGFSYQPRVVVWQVTEWNDCEDAERYANRTNPTRPQTKPWLDTYEEFSAIVGRLRKVFPRRDSVRNPHFVLYRRSDGFADERQIWFYSEGLAKSAVGLRELKRSITEADALCRARGIEFVVLFVPSHTRVMAPFILPRSHEERRRFSPPNASEGTIDLSRELADLCGKLGCPMVDLYPSLCRRSRVNNLRVYVMHDPHLGIDGHDEAAQQLVQCLRSGDGIARSGADPIRPASPTPVRR